MLSWRVPTTGDPSLLRLALAQVVLASIVAALILFVAVPRDWLAPALFGLIPVAVFMAYRRWRAYHQSFIGIDNVRLSDDGLYWLDAAGTEQSFSRSAVVGFHIGRDADTLRPVPSLTLHLQGGFESQPIELLPPATSGAVRRVLTEDWHLAEQPRTSEAESLSYDAAIAVYSECHEDFQEWHFEGPCEELLRLFDAIQAVAHDLALPPLGAKPLSRTIRFTRREPQRVKIAHSRVAQFDHDLLAAPAGVLEDIVAKGSGLLGESPKAADFKFDVTVAANNVWTFHIHIRQ